MSSLEPRWVSSDSAAPLFGGSDVAGDVGPAPTVRKPSQRDELPPLVPLHQWLIDAPSWLFSAGFHLAVIIILGLIIISPPRQDELFLEFGTEEGLLEDDLGEDALAVLDMPPGDMGTSLAPADLSQSNNDVVAQTSMIASPLAMQALPSDAEPIRMALTGREPGMQEALLGAYGGTRGTQQAVAEALKWLARNQEKTGKWSLVGPYADGAAIENPEAATALALLAFQGAGYTPDGAEEEPYTSVVSRGWTALLAQQDEHGNFFRTGGSNGQLYTHAICTIAACELYGMTQNSLYREPAQRALDFCAKIQAPEGGWRYFPGTGSDLSVTGWFVMAFQSARMAGLSAPSPVLSRVDSFLDSVSRENGSQYAYQPAQSASLSMTAEGLLCRQYRGWRRDDNRLQQGADKLVQNLPIWEDGERDVYYWYYATQVCHHMESEHWRSWNQVMRKLIPANQVREGKERGSWDPAGDRWGNTGGRLFVTCLTTYMLEVYYRHLPIYQLDLLGGGPPGR